MAYVHPKNGQNIEKVKKILEKTLQIPQNLRATPFIWGPYGIGKSEMVRQFAEEQCEKLTKQYIEEGRQDELFEVVDKKGQTRMVAFDPVPVDIRLSLKDSGDIQGLPTFHVDKNGVKRTTWAIPECFPSDPKWKGVIFFDEFNLGQMNVINACYQVLAEFQLEAVKFNSGVLVVCAGNYTDIAPNAIELPQGINTRVNHIDMVADLDVWVDWAMSAGINPQVITFLKTAHSDKFYDYEALDSNARELPNPRAWTRVSAFLDLPNYNAEQELVSDVGGIIGDSNALLLKSYIKDASRFQNPDEILVDGKDFKAESINGFYGCFINCVSKMTSMDDSKLEKAIMNVYKAITKLTKRELKAFAARSLINNNRIRNYIETEHTEIILDLAEQISMVSK